MAAAGSTELLKKVDGSVKRALNSSYASVRLVAERRDGASGQRFTPQNGKGVT